MAAESAPINANPTCIVLSREGKVEVSPKGSTQWIVAQTNQLLHVGDRLRTGFRSRTTLRWSDLSTMRVDALTSLELQPPETGKDKPQLDLKSGATYFFSREKPEEIQFRTPVASGAIRGTEFNLAVGDDGRTDLALLDGEVALTNPQGGVTLKTGEEGIVEPGKAPVKTAVINAINIIQWALYYPAVVAPDDFGLSPDEQQLFKDALQAYREGDLLGAVARYPDNRQPASEAERGFYAALLIAAGQVEKADATLRSAPAPLVVSNAIHEVIAAVKTQRINPLPKPSSGSEWMARSYYFQSESKLNEALSAARDAVQKAPDFGAAWVQVAQLEFGFGHTSDALKALKKGMELSPRNAEGLALYGFLLAAKNKNKEAFQAFNQAIAADGGLANGWLGRGLVKIRMGHSREGLEDLQVAATVEPQRAILRSYLGKAFNQVWDYRRAEKELGLARRMDTNDPTAWLYSALINEQGSQVNQAVYDLERSKELNDNRSVFRSKLLLDQDRAVRAANLAAIYRDDGMYDFGVQEASRAVNYDYGNYSDHLFLADSYDYLRDPKNINLRYESSWFSELLIADLLMPSSGGSLSQNISQQEYSRFFDGNHLGLYSDTEYRSSGDWIQAASQYGILGNSSYSIDESYRSETGQRPNNDLQQTYVAGRFKQQITEQDSVFAQVSYFNFDSGDLSQYFDQNQASKTLRVNEKQEPSSILGYHHEWSPGNHTLVLGARFDDTLKLNDSAPAVPYYQTTLPLFPPFIPAFDFLNVPGISLNYSREMVAYFAEAQQIIEKGPSTLILGGRYQTATADVDSQMVRQTGDPFNPVENINTTADANLDRISFYAYENYQLLDSLRLIAGVSYDHLHYPLDIDTSPIVDNENTIDKVSPKGGILWTPAEDTHVRAFYSQSLGGFSLDNSVRLEPAQIAGFNQTFRSAIPESVVGLVPGTEFESYGVGLDQVFKKTGTYFTIDGQFLNSDADRTIGIFTNSVPQAPTPDSPSSTTQSLDYKEKSLVVSANQLLGQEVSLGARYRLTYAQLEQGFPDLSPTTVGLPPADVSATLNQMWLYVNYNDACGFFSQFSAVWSMQSNHGYSGTPVGPGDSFWQFNLIGGYRFLRRHIEASVGVLNIGGNDYQLNPLTLYNELPRERTFVARLKFYF